MLLKICVDIDECTVKRRPCHRNAECTNTNVSVHIDSMIEITVNFAHKFREVTSVNATNTTKEMVKLALLTMHVNLETDFTIVGAMTGVSVEVMENIFVK